MGGIVGLALAGTALLALAAVVLIYIKHADKRRTIWGTAMPASLGDDTTLVGRSVLLELPWLGWVDGRVELRCLHSLGALFSCCIYMLM
jgi:hypothetical protein